MRDKSFNELMVYKKAHKLAGEVHDIMGLYDDEEFEDLVDEVRHASREVVRRISDAWTHRHFMSNIEVHLNNAINEVSNVVDLLKKAKEDDLVSDSLFDKKVKDYMEIQHDLMDIIERGEF